MALLHHVDASFLVAVCFLIFALIGASTGWIAGGIKALRTTASDQQQTVGLLLVAAGSLTFIAGMIGVRCASPIAALLTGLIR